MPAQTQAQQYLPRQEQKLQAWCANFAAKITATPTAYGLVAGQATAFSTLATVFATALTLATNTSTRTKSTVAAKNSAKQAVIQSARALAAIVQGTPTVTNQQREDLQLTVRNTIPSIVPPPTTAPTLTPISSAGNAINFRYADITTPASSAKPPGAIGLQLFVSTAATPPTSTDQMVFAGTYTKNTQGAGSQACSVTFDPLDAGKRAYLIARWVNRKGQTGPQSSRASMIISG